MFDMQVGIGILTWQTHETIFHGIKTTTGVIPSALQRSVFFRGIENLHS